MRVGKGRHSVDVVESAKVDSVLAAYAPTDMTIDQNGTRLGERLVAHGMVTEAIVHGALEQMGTRTDVRLGRVLIERGALQEVDLARALAEQYNLPLLDLGTVTAMPEAAALLPEATARALAALPIAIEGDVVHVGVADPTEAALQQVRAAIGRPIFTLVAPLPDIMSAIGSTYRAMTNVDSQVHAFEIRDKLRRDAARLETVNVNDEAPVVQVVQLVIAQGLRDRASDIHIEPSDDRIRVRYRVDGALHDVVTLPGSIGPAIISRIKIMANLNIVERRRPKTVRSACRSKTATLTSACRRRRWLAAKRSSCDCLTRVARCMRCPSSACHRTWPSATDRFCARRTAWSFALDRREAAKQRPFTDRSVNSTAPNETL